MSYEKEIEQSLRYLASEEAINTVKADAYWPKWDSPWWHMLLLYEMGEVKRIPKGIVTEFVATLNKIPLKIFPIHAEDMPDGVDPYRGSPCHCQLGTVYQVLSAWGIHVDSDLPWIRPWLLRYQMADGGLNCDNDAYLVEGESPSSMVGTISVFEALLLYSPRPWTYDESVFIDRCAQFLIGRKLMLGSQTKHNAAEQISAEKWQRLCFPRFYLYDVLRGLIALLKWAQIARGTIPPDAIRDVVTLLSQRYPDGQLRNERLSYEGVGTISQDAFGEWQRGQPATLSPLLVRVSAVGDASPFLSKQWAEALNLIVKNDELKRFFG
jgi:hypothetical protein